MNKLEFVRELSSRSGLNVHETYRIVNLFQTIVMERMTMREDLKLQGFGTFSPRDQSERLVRNPKTGAPVVFKPRTIVHFKTGKCLLDSINGVQPTAEPDAVEPNDVTEETK